MLAKQFRLPSSVVFRSPIVVHEKEFVMKSKKNNLLHNRFGFVVGKSVDKLATARNSLKRSFRAYVEKNWLVKQNGLDVLFVLRAAIKNAQKQDIERKIDAALGKAGLA